MGDTQYRELSASHYTRPAVFATGEDVPPVAPLLATSCGKCGHDLIDQLNNILVTILSQPASRCHDPHAGSFTTGFPDIDLIPHPAFHNPNFVLAADLFRDCVDDEFFKQKSHCIGLACLAWKNESADGRRFVD